MEKQKNINKIGFIEAVKNTKQGSSAHVQVLHIIFLFLSLITGGGASIISIAFSVVAAFLRFGLFILLIIDIFSKKYKTSYKVISWVIFLITILAGEILRHILEG